MVDQMDDPPGASMTPERRAGHEREVKIQIPFTEFKLSKSRIDSEASFAYYICTGDLILPF